MGANTSPGAPALRLSEWRGRLTLLTTVLGSGLAFLDTTVVNVALPTIGHRLHADLAGLQWVVNGYALMLAALILLGGALGDRFGRRRVYALGVTGFGVASAACALSPGIGALVAARTVQGVAAAMLTPGSLAILQSSFRREDRMRAIGAWTGLTGVAVAAGPLVGGWLIGHDWRWAFWLNVPLAVLVVALCLRFVPETRNPHAARRFDPAGVLLAALGLGGTTYALTAAPARGADALSRLTGIGGLACLAGFVVAEHRVSGPMVPLSLFASRVFSVINVVTLVVYAGLSGASLFLVVFLQEVAGWSPLAAGASTLPVSLALLLLAGRFGAVATRIGARRPMLGGTLLAAAGFALLALAPPDPVYVVHVLPGVCLLGLGLAMVVAPLTGTVLAAAPDELAGVASGTNNAVARTGGLLAVAGLPLLVGLSGTQYADPASLAPAYRSAMLVCCGLLVAGAALTTVGLHRGEGAATPGPGPTGAGLPAAGGLPAEGEPEQP